MTADRNCFLDTNILLTATDESRENHISAKNLISSFGKSGRMGSISGQVAREYLVVATRPLRVNGFGLQTSDALRNLDYFLSFLGILDETTDTAIQLRKLAEKYNLNGKRIHDANIVATMMTHGIKQLITENPADFSCFTEIQLLAIRSA